MAWSIPFPIGVVDNGPIPELSIIKSTKRRPDSKLFRSSGLEFLDPIS